MSFRIKPGTASRDTKSGINVNAARAKRNARSHAVRHHERDTTLATHRRQHNTDNGKVIDEVDQYTNQEIDRKQKQARHAILTKELDKFEIYRARQAGILTPQQESDQAQIEKEIALLDEFLVKPPVNPHQFDFQFPLQPHQFQTPLPPKDGEFQLQPHQQQKYPFNQQQLIQLPTVQQEHLQQLQNQQKNNNQQQQLNPDTLQGNPFSQTTSTTNPQHYDFTQQQNVQLKAQQQQDLLLQQQQQQQQIRIQNGIRPPPGIDPLKNVPYLQSLQLDELAPSDSRDIPCIPDLIHGLEHPDPEVMEDCLRRLSALSCLSPEVCDMMGEQGIVQPLAAILADETQSTRVVLDAISLCGNLLAYLEAMTPLFIHYDSLKDFVRLLSAPDGPETNLIRENAILAITSIVRCGTVYRNICLDHGAFTHLIPVAHSQLRLYALRQAAELMALFCKKPTPPLEYTVMAIPTLCTMLTFKDDDIMAEACAALASISASTPDEDDIQRTMRLDALVHLKAIPKMIALLSYGSTARSALITLGQIATGDQSHVQNIIMAGGIAPLLHGLSNGDQRVREYSAWVISNLAAGDTMDQVQTLHDNNVFAVMYGPFQTADAKTRCHMLWAIFNAVAHEDPVILNAIATQGWITSITNHLLPESQDVEALSVALDILYHFLSYGDSHKLPHTTDGTIVYVNVYGHIFSHGYGINRLKGLLSSPFDIVAKKSANLLVRFLGFRAEDVNIHRPPRPQPPRQSYPGYMGSLQGDLVNMGSMDMSSMNNDGGDMLGDHTVGYHDEEGNPVFLPQGSQFHHCPDDQQVTFDPNEMNQDAIFHL